MPAPVRTTARRLLGKAVGQVGAVRLHAKRVGPRWIGASSLPVLAEIIDDGGKFVAHVLWMGAGGGWRVGEGCGA